MGREPVPAGRRRGRNWAGAWRKTPGRVFGTGVIRLYQLTLSGFVGHSCRHIPTCSEYGYEAIARYGLWNGGFMALFRVARCGPGGTHGLDPVPEQLAGGARPTWPWRFWHLSARKPGDADG
ncbi:membrane protein insertion efficiency factor YidD [Pseudohoeflea coraliihabitans]|uniref:Putative membrane protein insertion efficiency factor n=1 Tax=Pseudohoeflea coraliihabitans TaxID=2860393 RepID=A0ABS6WT31_9HYPH|nr:membrane protein insertion efficiency factor YidD [Pseudohoeflea sp. DP4N28-3]MBW3098220.1 membrane protein insertion efficiency factor YidD [Pseudohoeflea sp. DP4N28-3]